MSSASPLSCFSTPRNKKMCIINIAGCTNKKSLLSYHSYVFFLSFMNMLVKEVFATPEGGLEREECSSQCAACKKRREKWAQRKKNIIHYNYDAIHLWVSISCELDVCRTNFFSLKTFFNSSVTPQKKRNIFLIFSMQSFVVYLFTCFFPFGEVIEIWFFVI